MPLLGGSTDGDSRGGKFARMVLDLLQRCRDLMHVLLISQQCWLRDPDRLPSGSVGVGKISFQERVFFLGLSAGKFLSILADIEHVEIVQRRVTRLIGNVLGIYCLNESFNTLSSISVSID